MKYKFIKMKMMLFHNERLYGVHHELFIGTLVNRLSIMLMTQIFEGKNLDVNTCAL